MKERSIGIVLGIINIAILAVLFFFFSLQDRIAPEIYIEESGLVYAAGIEDSALLEGISAIDEEDGDISDSIVIEKIVTDPEKGTAVITYGARDEAGNMVKASRKVEMIVEAEEDELTDEENVNEEPQNENSEDTDGEDNEDEGLDSEEDANSEDNESEELGSEEDADNEAGNENEDSAGDADREDERNSEDEEEDVREQQETLPTAGEASNGTHNVSSRQNSEKPSIVFKSQEMKMQVGSSPAWVDAIEGLHDDKDDYVYLFGNLKIEGDYDRNTPGTYDATVTTTDSDGNVSNSYPVKIVVVE